MHKMVTDKRKQSCTNCLVQPIADTNDETKQNKQNQIKLIEHSSRNRETNHPFPDWRLLFRVDTINNNVSQRNQK